MRKLIRYDCPEDEILADLKQMRNIHLILPKKQQEKNSSYYTTR